jgi:hypothetical protein
LCAHVKVEAAVYSPVHLINSDLETRAARRDLRARQGDRHMAAKLSGSGGGKFNLGQNSDINVTPFVDIMLVLLIIFMVAAPLATVSMKVDIPPARVPKNPVHEPVFINVEQDNKLYIGAEETSMKR